MQILSVVFAALLTYSTAEAVVVTVGDFSHAQGPTSELNVDGGATTSTMKTPLLTLPEVDSRTMSIEEKTFLDPGQNAIQGDSSLLDIPNEVGDDSAVITSWNLVSSILIESIPNVDLSISAIVSDGKLPALAPVDDTSSSGKFVVALNTVSRVVDFALNSAFAAAVNAGGTLKLPFKGAPRWDLALS